MTRLRTPSSRRPLRRRLLTLVAASVTGLALLVPSIASADSTTPPAATPSVIVVSPSSGSWSAPTGPDSGSWSAPESLDSGSWS